MRSSAEAPARIGSAAHGHKLGGSRDPWKAGRLSANKTDTGQIEVELPTASRNRLPTCRIGDRRSQAADTSSRIRCFKYAGDPPALIAADDHVAIALARAAQALKPVEHRAWSVTESRPLPSGRWSASRPSGKIAFDRVKSGNSDRKAFQLLSFVRSDGRNHFVKPPLRLGHVANIGDKLLPAPDDAERAVLTPALGSTMIGELGFVQPLGNEPT
jgi:hypothetical protein